MRERIQTVWAELEATPTRASGMIRRRLFADLPAALFAAIQFPEAARTLLLRLPTTTIKTPAPRLVQMRGVRTLGLSDSVDPANGFVAVALVEPRLSDLFDVLIADLAKALGEPMPEHQQGLTLIDRLEHWRDLFATYRGEELTIQARTGLYGELRWLQFLIESGMAPEMAVRAWRGSPGGDQDFVSGSCAVEVKTTETGEGLPISNERQLDEAPFARLFLIHNTVKSGDEGRTLPGEVDVVREFVGPETPAGDQFETRLAQVGYSDVHRDQYQDVRYLHEATQAYEVRDAFPRLTPSTLPPGIQGVSYRISPAACHSFLSDPAAAAAHFQFSE